MKTKVLIVGAGVIGTALQRAIVDHHTVMMLDPAKGLIVDLARYNPDFAFVCVPTLADDDAPWGFIEHPVRSALEVLNGLESDLIVALRSTVPPGTTEALAFDYPHLRLAFCPEFLTEATAEYDARHPPRNVVGFTQNDRPAAEQIMRVLPRCTDTLEEITTATDAELVKLFANGFYALKVAFVNLMHDLATKANDEHDPELFRDIVAADPMVADSHLHVEHKGYRGFGGKCLPKDLRMLITAMMDRGVDWHMLEAALSYNDTLIRSQGGEPQPREQTPVASAPSSGAPRSVGETS
jgi:UDPglucose 6-dehydrogenase